MATAIISARIDYCNSLLYSTTEQNLNHLQKIQNPTARIMHQASFQTSAKALRRQLHWLPIRQRIMYKLAIFTLLASIELSFQPCNILRDNRRGVSRGNKNVGCGT